MQMTTKAGTDLNPPFSPKSIPACALIVGQEKDYNYFQNTPLDGVAFNRLRQVISNLGLFVSYAFANG